MDPPTSLWKAFHPPPRGGDLKDIAKTVASLGNGAYAAVNGLRAWKTFQGSVDGSPGVTRNQIAASVGVDTTIAGRLLQPMVKAKVIIVTGDGHITWKNPEGVCWPTPRERAGAG